MGCEVDRIAFDKLIGSKVTVENLLTEMIARFCDEYCKYPAEYQDNERVLENCCEHCPFNILY